MEKLGKTIVLGNSLNASKKVYKVRAISANWIFKHFQPYPGSRDLGFSGSRTKLGVRRQTRYCKLYLTLFKIAGRVLGIVQVRCCLCAGGQRTLWKNVWRASVRWAGARRLLRFPSVCPCVCVSVCPSVCPSVCHTQIILGRYSVITL